MEMLILVLTLIEIWICLLLLGKELEHTTSYLKFLSQILCPYRDCHKKPCLYHSFSSNGTPKIVQEALNSKPWKDAINEELQALEKNKTREVMDLPKGKKTVGCRWIYTIKYKVDGTIERSKARLVAIGYTQTTV